MPSRAASPIAAESVRVVVRCDRQILHRASGILAEFMRRKWIKLHDYITRPFDADGDGDVDFHESRSGHTRVVVLSGADVAGDPEGVRITFPVPDGSRRSSLGAATNMATDIIAVTGATKSSQAPSTVYLRVCDRVADKKELAKKWTEALTAGAQKQQPLGNRYDGEDVSAKNPLTKALAARGLSFAKAS